ncbi:MAG: hypothetical protein V4556_03595 [Bacteroidota bacterium]
MKKLLLILFLSIGIKSFATEWASFYVYVQQEYVQGPWKRTDVLNQSGSNQYLHALQFEELFGTEPMQLASSIFSHLKAFTPERYKFNPTISIFEDTVIIKTKDSIAYLDAVKNELVASFMLNDFKGVKIIQGNNVQLFLLKDISVPYMDLISPSTPIIIPANDSLQKDGIIEVNPPINLTSKKTLDKNYIWMILSVGLNLILIILLITKQRRSNKE